MVRNIVNVMEIESGAELDGTVYDQWVRIGYPGHTVTLFDSNMLVPEDYVGKKVEIKVDTMFTELEPEVDEPQMVKGNRFIGKILSVKLEDSLYEHIVDLLGFQVTLIDNAEYRVGSKVRFKARLDVVEVLGTKGSWKNV